MKFGDTPLHDALGAILAHSLKLGPRILKKGRALTADDIAALAASGRRSVAAARLEPGDVGEDAAADRVARLVAGENVKPAAAFTGRVNLFAEAAGLCLVDRAAVDRLNAVDEAITLATLEPGSLVEPRQMAATVKIIPFAVRREALVKAEEILKGAGPLLRVAPFRPMRAALVQTLLPGLKPSILDKTRDATRARLAALGSDLAAERRVAHDESSLAPALAEAIEQGAGLVLVAGASAILDRRDVIPAAIAACRGEILHFGMPVDPGNLMLVGRIGAVPVLGLPGCARSPKVNGFDWVLRRIAAGLLVDRAAISGMGVGGLLGEIASRPLPRAAASEPPQPAPRKPRIAAIVLAAGRSSRMGNVNKLLIGMDGKPMLRHVVDVVLEAGVAPVIVVTGHERDQVAAALQGLDIDLVHNPGFAGGLSTSLRAGLDAVPSETDAALVCLGDMPRVAAAEIRRLIGAFAPQESRAIVVPTRNGKRGNPVLWGRQFFGEMRGVAGDVGARHLIGAYPEAVAEIEMDGDGVLTDIDTPQALARLAQNAKIEA